MGNYKATKKVLEEYTWQQRKHFYKEANVYLWDGPYLFKRSPHGLLRRCVAASTVRSIISHCNSSPYGGHHSGEKTPAKVLQSRFWRPILFQDCKA